jgi:3-oxoacyl-[acyl-carrier protein] reductase
MARHGITINSIQPGRIVNEQILRMHPTEEDRRHFSQQNIPAGRFGEPAELAVLAVFLASPLAGYITGTVIPVDGNRLRCSMPPVQRGSDRVHRDLRSW